MSPAQATGLLDVAAALALVALAIAISRWRRADLERDLVVAAVRAFVQLTAVGYVVQLVFDQEGLALVVALLAVQVTVGALTARGRARRVPGVLGPLFVALTAAAAGTLGLVLALGIFEPEPAALVPVGGMSSATR